MIPKFYWIHPFPIDLEEQTDIRLIPNQSENGKYNIILVWLNKIPKSFLSL